MSQQPEGSGTAPPPPSTSVASGSAGSAGSMGSAGVTSETADRSVPGPARSLAVVAAGIALVIYVLGFFGEVSVTSSFGGPLLIGGGLLAGTAVLPRVGRVLAPAAVLVVTGTLLLLQLATGIGGPTVVVVALALAFLQSIAVIAALLLDAGVVTAPARRPRARYPLGYGTYPPGAGGYPPAYGPSPGYGPYPATPPMAIGGAARRSGSPAPSGEPGRGAPGPSGYAPSPNPAVAAPGRPPAGPDGKQEPTHPRASGAPGAGEPTTTLPVVDPRAATHPAEPPTPAGGRTEWREPDQRSDPRDRPSEPTWTVPPDERPSG